MSERLPGNANPFSAATVALLIGVGVLAFIAIFALIGWSPDLVSKNRAGQHPYSDSALGYGGLVKLLEADGKDVSISRLASTLNYNDGLLVLTIPRFGFRRASDFERQFISEPALYVLPKWSGFGDRRKPQWQKDTSLLHRGSVSGLLADFDADAEVWRLRNPPRILTPFGPHRPDFEHQMQVIESDSLEPVIRVPGGALLVKLPGQEIYILSDPDLLNTFGLARRGNAGFALGLIDWLSEYDGAPITLDATLHGFERSESLLRAIFDIPFLGATLLAFATTLLIGWSAFIRFGPPEPETRNIAFGKKALAESSAGLVSMARREGQMAPGYLALTRRALTRSLGLPTKLSDEDLARTLNNIAKQKQLEADWSLETAAMKTPAANRDELRDKAAALWRWRKEMTDGN